jgi:uncharacterized protein YgiM (DUF1202 family)
MRITNVGEGDKRLVVSYPGYKSISSFVKLINGYQLVAEVDLTKEEDKAPMVEPTPTLAIKTVSVKIKQTETGWLRVRSQPNASGTEIMRVNAGETYSLVEEKTEWYKINLGNNNSGWISTKYAEKVTL